MVDPAALGKQREPQWRLGLDEWAGHSTRARSPGRTLHLRRVGRRRAACLRRLVLAGPPLV